MPSLHATRAKDSLQYVAHVLREHMSTINFVHDFQPLSSLEERNDIRKLVDERITLLLAHLVDLKQYRNSIASISLLPNDVLSQILFEYVLVTDPWSGKWTKILFVCRRWYELCMADARLWSFISMTRDLHSDGGRAMEWLNRSKDHALRIKYTLLENDPYRQYIFPGITQRITVLHLSGEFQCFAPFFRDVQSLPLLQRLKVECIDNTTHPLFQIPEFIFDGETPGLHDVDIRGPAIIKTAHLTNLRNLTRLHLQFSPRNRMEAEVVPSLSDLVQTLRQSPSLQYLNIQEFVKLAGEVTFTEPVSLTLLQDLSLILDVEVMDMLLRAIKIPPATYLYLIPQDIYDSDEDGLSDHFTHLLVWISQHFRSKGAPFLRSVRLRADDSYAAVSAHHTYECPSLLSSSEARPHFSIVVHPFTQPDTRKILTKILNVLHLRHEGITLDVTEILHGGPEYLTVPSWVRIFRCIPVPMIITAGNNGGTSTLLEGLLAAMNRPAKKLKDQRVIDLRLLRLVINASAHPHYFALPDAAEAAHKRAYSALVELLTAYEALDLPWKRKGRRVPSLEVTRIQGGHAHVYGFCRDLWEVCDELIVDGHEWHPVKNRNSHKSYIKELKEKRARGRHPFIPPEDENLSDEEAVLPRQTQETPKNFSDRVELLPDELKHICEEEFGEVMM